MGFVKVRTVRGLPTPTDTIDVGTVEGPSERHRPGSTGDTPREGVVSLTSGWCTPVAVTVSRSTSRPTLSARVRGVWTQVPFVPDAADLHAEVDQEEPGL